MTTKRQVVLRCNGATTDTKWGDNSSHVSAESRYGRCNVSYLLRNQGVDQPHHVDRWPNVQLCLPPRKCQELYGLTAFEQNQLEPAERDAAAMVAPKTREAWKITCSRSCRDNPGNDQAARQRPEIPSNIYCLLHRTTSGTRFTLSIWCKYREIRTESVRVIGVKGVVGFIRSIGFATF